MAYIGKRPTDTFRSLAVKDTFTGDGSTVAFDISQECGSANDLMVFVDNVRQEPGSGKSYTLGEDGNVIVTIPPVVLIGYASPATAVKLDVLTDCQFNAKGTLEAISVVVIVASVILSEVILVVISYIYPYLGNSLI